MQSAGYKIFASIGDLHIGNRNVQASDLKRQLKEHFFSPLSHFHKLDMIAVLGDTTHQVISLNSSYAELTAWFASEVYKLAKKKNAVVVWILGTPSHDLSNLDTIKHYQTYDDVDFRFYDKFTRDRVWDSYEFLAMPDLKVSDKKVVRDLLDPNHPVDFILGHGLIADMEFFSQESESNPTKTYVYTIDELEAASRGPVLFGHIHSYRRYGTKFVYGGPFTLLERGGDSAGFLVSGIADRDHTKFVVEHYDNPDASDYYDLEVTPKMLREIPTGDIVAAINEIAEEARGNDIFTLRITRDDDMDSLDKVVIIETHFRKDRRFSIVKKIRSKKQEEREEQQKQRKERYNYIMDEGIGLAEIMYTYYINDMKPLMPDQSSIAATLIQEDFERAIRRDRDG